MKVIPYISVPNAKKAIKLYEELFGAELVSSMPFDRSFGENMGLPEDFNYTDSTMHARAYK